MAKVGRFVTDPKAGAYCNITLESGHRIMVSHDQASLTGGTLTITELKWLGFASGETLFTCDLASVAGQAALRRLVEGAPEGSARATPIGALIDFVKDCTSTDEVKTKCAALVAAATRAPGAD